MMTFNAMSKSWTGRLSAVTLTFRRLPSVASGQYYESVLNQAGYTLAVPCFGLKNGVHLTNRHLFSQRSVLALVRSPTQLLSQRLFWCF